MKGCVFSNLPEALKNFITFQTARPIRLGESYPILPTEASIKRDGVNPPSSEACRTECVETSTQPHGSDPMISSPIEFLALQRPDACFQGMRMNADVVPAPDLSSGNRPSPGSTIRSFSTTSIFGLRSIATRIRAPVISIRTVSSFSS